MILAWFWTLLCGCGAVFAALNLREVLIDNWALSRSQQGGVSVLKLQTRGAVYDHALILVALGGDFLAGVFGLLGEQIGALIALIMSAIALVVLSFSQTQRRRRIFHALRLRRPAL